MQCLSVWMNKLPPDSNQSNEEACDPHQIGKFTDYLKGSIDRIEGLCESDHDGQCRLFKKTLLFALLDGLATPCKGSKPRRHQKNFRSFLVNFGDWEQGDRISLPHLCRWLEINPTAMSEAGREFFLDKLTGWSAGEIHHTDDDPTFEDVCRSLDEGQLRSSDQLGNITHAGLLVHQRNCLVHEFNHNGVNIEFPDDVSPYYLFLGSWDKVLETREDGQGVWQLLYPSGFLFWLARRCLANFELFLLQNRINPRSSYSLGSYLWPQLNR